MPDLRSRFRGCLLGGAVGDALGAEIEFLTRNEIVARFGDAGPSELGTHDGVPGAITDDTQMTLFTAEGLLRAHHRGATRGIVSAKGVVLNAYLRWLGTQERGAKADGSWLYRVSGLHVQRAPGHTCLGALRAWKRHDWSGPEPTNTSKGCGGVMRMAPVGLAWHQHPGAAAFSIGVRPGRESRTDTRPGSGRRRSIRRRRFWHLYVNGADLGGRPGSRPATPPSLPSRTDAETADALDRARTLAADVGVVGCRRRPLAGGTVNAGPRSWVGGRGSARRRRVCARGATPPIARARDCGWLSRTRATATRRARSAATSWVRVRWASRRLPARTGATPSSFADVITAGGRRHGGRKDRLRARRLGPRRRRRLRRVVRAASIDRLASDAVGDARVVRRLAALPKESPSRPGETLTLGPSPDLARRRLSQAGAAVRSLRHALRRTRPVTYLQFHFVFTLPLLAASWRSSSGGRANRGGRSRLLVGIAVVYTTPWDNYLVAREVWSVSARPPCSRLPSAGCPSRSTRSSCCRRSWHGLHRCGCSRRAGRFHRTRRWATADVTGIQGARRGARRCSCRLGRGWAPWCVLERRGTGSTSA